MIRGAVPGFISLEKEARPESGVPISPAAALVTPAARKREGSDDSPWEITRGATQAVDPRRAAMPGHFNAETYDVVALALRPASGDSVTGAPEALAECIRSSSALRGLYESDAQKDRRSKGNRASPRREGTEQRRYRDLPLDLFVSRKNLACVAHVSAISAGSRVCHVLCWTSGTRREHWSLGGVPLSHSTGKVPTTATFFTEPDQVGHPLHPGTLARHTRPGRVGTRARHGNAGSLLSGTPAPPSRALALAAPPAPRCPRQPRGQ